MDRKTFTRDQLYDRVWNTPITQLAKRFGLSDVGFAKTCRKYDIPLPPPGYWAKVKAGQSPAKTKLPDSDVIDKIELNELSDEELSDKKQAQAKAKARNKIIITLAASLRGAHPLVSSAREVLAQGKVNDSGIVLLPENTKLNISVSRAQSRRALRIMDAILKYAQSEKYEVKTGPAINIQGETVHFGIREALLEIREQPQNVELKERYEFLHSVYDKRYETSGMLTLFIDASCCNVSGGRRQWKDTEKKKVEECLGEFFQGAIDFATKMHELTRQRKIQTIAEHEARRARAKQERHWAEVRRHQAEEQERLDELLEQVKSYKLATDIREFVDACRMSKLNRTTDPATEGLDEEWAVWALSHADRYDPACPSAPSILDEEIPEGPRRY